MGFCGLGAEGEFGKGFGDTGDGFELADRDRDGGAEVGCVLGSGEGAPDRDEVGRELFCGGGR